MQMQIALRVLVKIMAHAYPRPSGVNVHWNFQESFATSVSESISFFSERGFCTKKITAESDKEIS